MKTRLTQTAPYFYHTPTWTSHWQEKAIQVMKHGLQALCKRYQSIFQTVAVIVGLAGLFLGGAYLFLVQLATHGWQ